MTYMLGKKPAAPLSKKAIKFGDIFNPAKLPTPPMEFGRYNLVKNWGMLGNDEFGCCVFSNKAHMHMLWSKLGGHVLDLFTTFGVLGDYSFVTGFNASDPNSDQGTDMKAAAEFHRKIGVLDKNKVRRRVSSYVNNAPGNVDQIAICTYLFGAVEIGVILSNENMEQFDNEKVWTVTGTPVGGHCIPIVGRDGNGDFVSVSWGRTFKISPAFLQKQMDEGLTYLSKQTLNSKGIAGGFNEATLNEMLAKVSPQVFAQEERPDEAIRYGFAAPAGRQPIPDQFEVSFRKLRYWIDKSGYGFMLSDDKLKPIADDLAVSIVQAGPDEPEEEVK